MVGLISQDGIRIESHLELSIGETYPLHTHWSNKGILKSPLAECASSTGEDLYYNYKYAQEFAFHFAAPLLLNDEMTESEYEEAENEREKLYDEAVGLLGEWVDNNKDLSHPKALKTLVVDKALRFYDSDELTDGFAFVLRCQPYLKNPLKDLKRVYPRLIVYNLEDVTNEELEANDDIAYSYNDMRSLQYMLKTIRSIDGYNPYICLLYTSPSPRDKRQSRMPSSA